MVKESEELRRYISIADNVNTIFQDTERDRVFMPEIVMIGTQSSGKSSLINKIIGFDILPTGDSMVTRLPIKIKLHNTEDTTEFKWKLSRIENGEVKVVGGGSFDINEPSVEHIRVKISEETKNIAKVNNISNTPIYLDITYAGACELSFVDLPGLVTIAKTDHGQSATIVEDIKRLVKSYIRRPNTIVLTVLESNIDLEANLALSIVKELQYEGQVYKSVGVLTKPDLVARKEKVINVISDEHSVQRNISERVMLDLGYFVVNSISDNEEEYFNNYSKGINLNRCGSKRLRGKLSEILVEAIKKELPNIVKELKGLKERTNHSLTNMGDDLVDNNSKMRYIRNMITTISEMFNSSLDSMGIQPNIGADIRSIFDSYMTEMDKLRPFNEQCTDVYFENIINSFKGYRMSNVISQHVILERFMQDPMIKPLTKLTTESTRCLDLIEDTLVRGFHAIIQSVQGVNQHRLFVDNMKSFYVETVKELKRVASSMIMDFMKIEEGYVFTTEKRFVNALKKEKTISEYDDSKNSVIDDIMVSKDPLVGINGQTNTKYKISALRKLGDMYFASVRTRILETVLKTIVTNLINALKKEIPNRFFQKFLNEESTDLLREDRELLNEKLRLKNLIEKIDLSVGEINNM